MRLSILRYDQCRTGLKPGLDLLDTRLKNFVPVRTRRVAQALQKRAILRLSCNMATGKGLAVIFRPKTINLISNNKLNKLTCIALQHCNTCQRHVATVASTISSWNRGKTERSKVYTSSTRRPPDYIIVHFPTRFPSVAFASLSPVIWPLLLMFQSSIICLEPRMSLHVCRLATCYLTLLHTIFTLVFMYTTR